MSELQLVTAPTTTPVSLVEAFAHLRETEDANTDDIAGKLNASIDYCQRRVVGGRQFCSATYDLRLQDFPSDGRDCRIAIPRPPLNKITWIKYYDTAGVLQTFGSTLGSTASTDYYITMASQDMPGYVVPAYSKTWPSTRDRPDAVTVRFIAGSTDVATIPDTSKAAVLLKLEHLYDPERVDEAQQMRAIDDLLQCTHTGFYG